MDSVLFMNVSLDTNNLPNLGAVHNGVATIKLKGIIQIGQALLGLAVTRIFNPTIGLHEYGRSVYRESERRLLASFCARQCKLW